jgi:hypothetical protein
MTLKQLLESWAAPRNKPELTKEQCEELGRRVCSRFFEVKQSFVPIHRVPSEDGSYKVINYPKSFRAEAELVVQAYFDEVFPPERKRQRKPLKPRPVFSTRLNK